ncbi:MAG: N-acetyltransferase [Clostridia bacterium]|nr:N-acetyltransferase [Clostridia bacterium]
MVTIKEVKNNRDLRTFVKFPNDLYKGNPYFVPDLITDEVNTLRKDKNPAFDFSDSIFFLAYRGKKLVGRIGVLVNHKSNEKWNQKNARFTHFDFIDDFEVSKTLMDTAESWARKNGYREMQGPLGLTDMDHQGMLIDGYEELDMFITIYNHPYYIKHMELLGYEKEVDWFEYQISIPQEPNDKYSRIAEIVQKKYGYQLIEFDKKKDILKWAPKVFELYNKAYAPLFGTTELSQRQIDMYIKSFFGFVNPDFIKIIVNKENEVIGFGITMPSISKAMQKANGKLFPFGFIYLLRALKKNDRLDMYLVAIRPDAQGTGANALLLDSITKSAVKHGMKIGETGPELENNKQVQTMWKYFDTRQHRKRRVYKKEL